MPFSLVGRRGLVGLFTTHGAKGRRFETGRLLFFFIIANVPSANWREEIAAPSCREKKGGSGGEGGSGDDDLFRKWNGYEKRSFRFVSKTIKWLTPSIKGIDMERKL